MTEPERDRAPSVQGLRSRFSDQRAEKLRELKRAVAQAIGQYGYFMNKLQGADPDKIDRVVLRANEIGAYRYAKEVHDRVTQFDGLISLEERICGEKEEEDQGE